MEAEDLVLRPNIVGLGPLFWTPPATLQGVNNKHYLLV